MNRGLQICDWNRKEIGPKKVGTKIAHALSVVCDNIIITIDADSEMF